MLTKYQYLAKKKENLYILMTQGRSYLNRNPNLIFKINWNPNYFIQMFISYQQIKILHR